MIDLNLTPQRNDNVRILNYEIDGDILTVTINDKEEVFDFTNLSDGVAESIEVEVLEWNPIVEVEKFNGTVDVLMVRFYNESELEEFEDGYN